MLTQTELLRLARTNFSEAYQILVHLKVLRLFVESALRYGLPAAYVVMALKVRVAPQSLAGSNRIPASRTLSNRRRSFPCSHHILRICPRDHKVA